MPLEPSCGRYISTYIYLYANLLQSVTNGSAVSSMTWDAAGNRVSFTSSTDPSNPYYFVYDTTARSAWQDLWMIIYQVQSLGGTLLRRQAEYEKLLAAELNDRRSMLADIHRRKGMCTAYKKTDPDMVAKFLDSRL